MRYGIMFANTAPFRDPVRAVELGKNAAETGFESVPTVEHVSRVSIPALVLTTPSLAEGAATFAAEVIEPTAHR